VERGLGFPVFGSSDNGGGCSGGGINGTYHHVSQQHLKRYLAEFDFRYNERSALEVTDAERADKALKDIEGKRLTYRRTDSGRSSQTSLNG